MSFRPSALGYTVIVLLGWTLSLAIALGRVELFFVAVPLVVAILRSPAPRGVSVGSFCVIADPTPIAEGEPLRFTISADVRSAPGPVELLPVLPSLLASAKRAVLIPAPDGHIRWEIEVPCLAAGMADLGVVFFRIWDSAGLWAAECRHEQRIAVAVYPRATIMGTLPAPRLTGSPFGVHASNRVDDGTDFADVRPFATGDRVRRINWPVSLRSRQLQVNQFYSERSGEIVILLDSFSNIGRRPDARLDHCLRAAASLALSYLRRQDRVGLLEYGGWIRWTRPATGPAQFARIRQALARVTISQAEFLHDLTLLPESMLPRHALIIALTTLADERFPGMVRRLAEQGRDTVLLALRTDEISWSALPRRGNNTLVRRLWLLEREEKLRALRARGIRAVNWQASLPLEATLRQMQRPTGARAASW